MSTDDKMKHESGRSSRRQTWPWKGCEEMAMARPFLRPISERELSGRESILLPDCIVKPLIPSRAMAEMSVQAYLTYGLKPRTPLMKGGKHQ